MVLKKKTTNKAENFNIIILEMNNNMVCKALLKMYLRNYLYK